MKIDILQTGSGRVSLLLLFIFFYIVPYKRIAFLIPSLGATHGQRPPHSSGVAEHGPLSVPGQGLPRGPVPPDQLRPGLANVQKRRLLSAPNPDFDKTGGLQRSRLHHLGFGAGLFLFDGVGPTCGKGNRGKSAGTGVPARKPDHLHSEGPGPGLLPGFVQPALGVAGPRGPPGGIRGSGLRHGHAFLPKGVRVLQAKRLRLESNKVHFG